MTRPACPTCGAPVDCWRGSPDTPGTPPHVLCAYPCGDWVAPKLTTDPAKETTR